MTPRSYTVAANSVFVRICARSTEDIKGGAALAAPLTNGQLSQIELEASWPTEKRAAAERLNQVVAYVDAHTRFYSAAELEFLGELIAHVRQVILGPAGVGVDTQPLLDLALGCARGLLDPLLSTYAVVCTLRAGAADARTNVGGCLDPVLTSATALVSGDLPTHVHALFKARLDL